MYLAKHLFVRPIAPEALDVFGVKEAPKEAGGIKVKIEN
jgi:hypothetical protein